MPPISPLPSEDPQLTATETADVAQPQTDESLLQWHQSEPTASHRPTYWYVVIGLIFATAILAAILTHAWVFVPLGILVPITLAKYGSNDASEHSYELTTQKVLVDDKHFAYDNFKAYFTVENGGQTIFELVPIKRFGTLVTLHASDDDVEDVNEILSSVLPVTEPQGYLGESIFQRLKF